MSMADSIRPSLGTRLSENVHGRTVDLDKPSVWRHPWYTTAEWMPQRKAFVAFVLAGFLNGMSPVVRTTADALREARGTFFGQLVDARSGADEIAQLALLAIGGEADSGVSGDTLIDVPLYQNPPIGLFEWRKIGWDGASAVPIFFQQRGVAVPPRSVADQLTAGGKVALDTFSPPQGNRLLRACDIMLHQPRIALTSQIEISPLGLATGATNVNQTLGFREAPSNDRLMIQTGTFENFEQERLNFRSQSPSLLASNYEERTWDQLHISTVWVMSPPDVALDAAIDSTWQVFASHNQFWNLAWGQRLIEPVFTSDIFGGLLATVSLLAGGAGFGAANYIAASINDATQSAFNILTAQSLSGSFWTPTGGGTTSAYPPTPATEIKPGLDKSVTAAAKARAAQAQRLLSLDPVFPYEGLKFNRSLLS